MVMMALFVMSAVLPIIGFARLLWRAQRGLNRAQAKVDERGHSDILWGDVGEANAGDIRGPYLQERNDLIWDIALVGAGLTAGAAASIWSMFQG